MRLIISVTARPKAWVTRSTSRLNQANGPRCGADLCRSSAPHIAGVSVSATNPDTDTETTIVIANCL
jgi:hypothetical protein